MPALRCIVLIVRGFLAKRGLNSPANGGLGSYAILCLAICFLKLNPKQRSNEDIEKPLESESLGKLVMDFFDYFGNEFPYGSSYVAAAQGKILPKGSMGWVNENNPEALSIECLINQGRDIGKATSRISQVRAAFQEAFSSLQVYPFTMSHGNILGSILGVSEKTMDRRKHIEHLVDSGSFETDLAALVLPPAWTPLKSHNQHSRSYRPYQHQQQYSNHFGSNYRHSHNNSGNSPYAASGYAGATYPAPSAYASGMYGMNAPQSGYGYASYPAPVYGPYYAQAPPDTHAAKRQRI